MELRYASPLLSGGKLLSVIPGVSEEDGREFVIAMGSVHNVMTASLNDLIKNVDVDRETVKLVYEYFHK